MGDGLLGNTRHGLKFSGVSPNPVPGKIETNRWHDIRIAVQGPFWGRF